ncbi:low temperature requirement protein A [Streptomyces sp. NBC_01016]|uniref:low temperature requirement protein A n=1 Tax=Streptomyces sp. NBC_01016 TaxID=2903720 RepID=UPI002252C642|nr:low temperature requirement protein A [Streptomyces sp. NBC_01016]MCX4835779.1 low temperature requirement protein A [Streptomyces sp. NBC_01016]
MPDSLDAVDEPVPERHASWLELFFDLIVVAGVGQLSHLLHTGPTWAALGEYGLLFLAFWLTWVMFTMYGNVAQDRARTLVVIVAMFGMAVMAAAVPGVRESDEKAFAFALAYVVVRVIASRAANRPGRVIVDLPILQLSGGLVPWIVSLWVGGDARLWLWALGLAIDVFVMVRVSRDAMQDAVDERWDTAKQRVQRRLEQEERRSGAGHPAHDIGERGRRALTKPELVTADVTHLSERLGLFVLIVLGEGLVQSVDAAGEAEWNGSVRIVAVGAFAILVLVWVLALLGGAHGLPLLVPEALPVHLVLPLHCLFAGAVAALAAVLGRAVADADGALPGPARMLLGAVVALILLTAAVCAAVSGRGWRWTAGAVLPALVVAGLLTVGQGPSVSEGLGTGQAVVLAVVAVGWPVVWRARRGAAEPATAG